MVPRLVCCSLLLTVALGCSNQSRPTSTESDPTQLARSLAQEQSVHTVVTKTTELDIGRNSTIDIAQTVTTSYDRSGNALSEVIDYREGGFSNHEVIASIYNKLGNIIEQTHHVDLLADGSVDTRNALITLETDEKDRPTQQLFQSDFGNDFVADYFATISTTSYDPHARPLEVMIDQDVNADQTVEARVTNTISYDPHGNVVSFASESSNGDFLRSAYEYNQHGVLVRQITEYDRGLLGYREITTTTEFDNQGNPIEQIIELEGSPGGAIEAVRLVTMTFDERHRPVYRVEDIDNNADGTFDDLLTTTYQYLGPGAPKNAPALANVQTGKQPKSPSLGVELP